MHLNLEVLMMSLMAQFRPMLIDAVTNPDSGGFIVHAVPIFGQTRYRPRPMPFSNPDEKQQMMAALALAARITHPLAVALVMDAAMLDESNLPHDLRLENRTNPTVQELHEHTLAISKWLRENCGGRIVNLPAHLRLEAFIVVVKGPDFPVQMLMQRYRVTGADGNKKVEWIDTQPTTPDKGTEMLFNMLPDWWKPDPLIDAMEQAVMRDEKENNESSN